MRLTILNKMIFVWVENVGFVYLHTAAVRLQQIWKIINYF